MRDAGLRAMAAWALLNLAACASPPAVPRPADTTPPARWSHAGAAPPVRSDAAMDPARPWWAELGDPRLDALQEQVLRGEVEMLRKAIAWRIAELQVRQAALAEQPQASLSLGASSSRSLRGGGGSTTVINGVNVPVAGTSGSWQSNYGANLSLGYEWDVWSRLSASTQAAQADAQARLEDLREARGVVSLQVAQAYWRIAALDAQQPLLVDQQRLADEAVRLAQRRLEEGKLRVVDVDTAISQRYQVQKRLEGAKVDRALHLQTLGRLLDQPAPALEPGDARLPAAEPPAYELDDPPRTLERRPDVRRARMAVDAELARAQVAEAARYPALRLNPVLTTSGSSWRDWFSQPLATLGLSLAVPLVDWRRLDAQRDVARLTLDDAALALRAAVRQALADVESALLEGQRWQADWRAAQTLQEEKRRAERVARQRFTAGAAARLDLIQAHQARLDAEVILIDMRLHAWLNRAQLLKAVGAATTPSHE
ncbi:MAG TPA: TolC family protein [Roseateles sp.]